MKSKLLALSMITVITATLMIGSFTGPAFAQPGTWTAGAPFNHPTGGGIEGHAASAIGSKIYVSHGFYANTGDDWFTSVYDTTTDTWNYSLSSAPTKRAELAGASAGGMHYAIGGRTGGSSAINEQYNPVADTWATKAPMPTARATEHTIVEEGLIYVIGGRTAAAPGGGGELSANERYDPSSDTWKTLSPLPTPVSDAVALSIPGSGKIFVIGGYNNGAQSLVQIYDISSDSWSAGTPMPTPRYSLVGGYCGSNLHLFGGLSPISNVHEVYDTTTDTWSVGPAMPNNNAEVQGVSVNGKIHIIGQGVFGNAGRVHDIWNCDLPVGGQTLPISSTALLVAGFSSMAVWIVPVSVGIAGAGIAAYKLKRHN